MRKSIVISGLSLCALLATAVIAAETDDKKKDDGPGMTMSQKVTSLFGLIDRGAISPPPPTPPGMPPMNSRARTTASSNGSYQYAPKPGAASQAMRTSSGNNSFGSTSAARAGAIVRDPSLPQPPQPRAITEGSVGATSSASRGYEAAPATAVVSDQSPAAPRTLATPSAAAMQMAAAPRTSIVGATKAPTYAAQPVQARPNTAPAPTPAAPFVSSRRRVVDSSAPVAAEANVTVEANPPELVPIATPTPIRTSTGASMSETASSRPAAPSAASSYGSEPVLPSIPPLVDEAKMRGTPTLASSSAAGLMPPPSVSDNIRSPTLARPAPTMPSTTSTSSTTSPPVASVAAGSDLLVSHTNPEITVDTLGPRRVSIGRPAEYRIVVRNRGEGEARDVVVSLQLPEHVEIAGLHGSSGSSTSADEVAAGSPLQWRLDGVAGRSEETLTMTLVPRRSDAMELGVRWTCSAPLSRAMVEVEEPRLAMAITGPNEVGFGEQRLFKLTVSNPGSGMAENVVIQLMPLNPGDGEPVRHNVGTLKAGESSVIEVELTARQAGALRIRTEAQAEGNLRAEAAADVLVRRAVLDVVAAAPRVLFAGVPGNYEVRVRNLGDDTARNVRVAVNLPMGVKLLSTAPAAQGDAKSGQLVWTFDRVAPGSEQVCSIKCSWDQGGNQQLTVTATADGDVQKSAVASTEVQAVADLALDVIDTPGPAPLGRPVAYEIRIRNRGLKSAEGVEIVAYFSDGIEPDRAEGQTHELQPGMVVFRPLPSIGPGQEKVLKVTARAHTAGHHRLRVEMISGSPQTQLSHEDAKYFYSDEMVEASPASSPASFKAQEATPIGGTNRTTTQTGEQPAMMATPPSYRVNTIR